MIVELVVKIFEALYGRVVLAIVETVGSLHQEPPSACASVASFLIEQQMRMPDYLHRPIRILTWLFACSPIVFGGRSFLGMTQEQRCKYLANWKRGRFAMSRDFVRLYEGLAVFAFAAETEGIAAAPVETSQPDISEP